LYPLFRVQHNLGKCSKRGKLLKNAKQQVDGFSGCCLLEAALVFPMTQLRVEKFR
jgi:hypothetical protein